jgi:predicted transcriptional regulator with HTH domain
MELAKKAMRPDLKWQTFKVEDMLAKLKAPRAICIMDSSKLEKKCLEYGYKIKPRREALKEVFQIMAENKE